MSLGARFLAVDWGTTNRRIYRIEDGMIADRLHDARGVKSVARDAYPAEIAAMRTRFGDLPVLMAGMVGSSIGWRDAGYVAAPAGLEAIAAGLAWIDARTALVPGVSVVDNGRGDVMRGEEVQLFGAVTAGLAPPDALLVQPGTHCKWAEMAAGRIARFTTAMTGELFALLRGQSILAPQLGGAVTAGPAFLDGVAAARDQGLAAALFGVRAAGLLGLRDDTEAAAYTSGLLIGADVDAALRTFVHREVHLLADPALGALYAAATTAHGRTVQRVDSEAAFIAGITAIGALT
ncbi:2-dehydro-3-deoxygalactonokinase [Sphingomonas sp.]|jgi:2-dehydro-3-deoxygalactonokinase|uniref:2-dehydro-3-deoxygalactonokinase n=1 Tax=Sphingomonas sp. TaxID=28214 RepID=UPI0035C79ECE